MTKKRKALEYLKRVGKAIWLLWIGVSVCWFTFCMLSLGILLFGPLVAMGDYPETNKPYIIGFIVWNVLTFSTTYLAEKGKISY
jgi:hypothetical protein